MRNNEIASRKFNVSSLGRMANVQVKSWGDEKASLQLEIDFMMRRRNEER